jgi:DNA-directed RNA polymerase specialized sigma24 family protein
MSEWLNIVAKHHKEHVKLVRSWGGGDYSEDLVQEMYLRLHRYTTPEKIIKDGEVNLGFIWFTLRNMYLTLVKEQKKYSKVNLEDIADLIHSEPDIIGMLLLDKITTEIEEELKEWEKDPVLWYTSKIFTTYVNSGDSLRVFGDKVDIHYKSIFDTVKKCREMLVNKYGEDYSDILNKDYELL